MTMPPFMMASRRRRIEVDCNRPEEAMPREARDSTPTCSLKRGRDSSMMETGSGLPVMIQNAKVDPNTLEENQLNLIDQFADALSRGYAQCRPTSRRSTVLDNRIHSDKMQIPRVDSVPVLVQLPHACSGPPRKKHKTIPYSTSSPELANLGIVGGPASASELTRNPVTRDPNNDVNPEDYLKDILKSNGYEAKPVASLSLKNFFKEMSAINIIGYGTEVINAVRQENVQELREMHRSGKNLQCCNKFGESIVHMACRRGSEKVLRFLMEEAKVSVCVRDDYGRTPLHDACWTREPEFGLVSTLIRTCPDLLLVSDRRGHTPLSYVRRDHWVDWCTFLKEHSDMLQPSELLAQHK